MNRILLLIIALLFTSFAFSQEDYYWVGGQGAWSNINNWKTSSGLTPTTLPTNLNTVIFNENSQFSNKDTVFILMSNPVCKSMIWENLTDTVVMFGGADTTALTINGSIRFHEKLINAYAGRTYFYSGSSGNTITSNGVQFNNSIIFEGTGSWIIQDTLIVWDTSDWMARFADPAADNPLPDAKIFLRKGQLNINGQVVITEGFRSTEPNTRSLNMANSDFMIIGDWDINAQGFSLMADNSLITLRGVMTHNSGTALNYHNLTFLPEAGSMSNTDIRTRFNFIHFLGLGSIEGEQDENVTGSYTIDTLIIEGLPPFPSQIFSAKDSVNYALFNSCFAEIDERHSYYHKLICNLGTYLYGVESDIDSMLVYGYKGTVAGNNTIDYLFFDTDGVLAGAPGEPNQIGHLVFSGDGTMQRSNIINDLTLNTGFWYQIKADSLGFGGNYTYSFIQTITGQIEVVGDCERGLSTLSSDLKTYWGMMDYQGPTVSTEYLMVRDINNMGTPLAIDNGVDKGNNIGINFNSELTTRDLYWVGGQGVWSDKSHWADQTGIPDQCPPNLLDNVFFDANSFGGPDTVWVDVKYAQFNDMTWEEATNNPVFIGPDTSGMKIWGSLTFNPNMEMGFGGRFYFESEYDTTPETVNMAGKGFYSNTYFDGVDGKWMFSDSIKMNQGDDTLFLVRGSLNMNDQYVRCNIFNSADTLERELYLGNSKIEVLRGENSDAWNVNGYQLTFDGGTSLIRSLGINAMIPGQCHIRTTGGELTYYNIEFDTTSAMSILKSESVCHYNLVTYYAMQGDAIGMATIDTLTYDVLAPFCRLRNMYTVNVVDAYGYQDSINGGQHTIGTANFYDEGTVLGFNSVDSCFFHKHGSIFLSNFIGYCEFKNNGEINGRNQFNTLKFSPGYKYFFEHDSTQIIFESFDVQGTCLEPIRIQSDSIGTQAKIKVQKNNIEITYVSMRDIVAIDYNGNNYTAFYSNDLGNNGNWDFELVDDATFYWIGGQGNWGNGNNWSYVSGSLDDIIGCVPRELNDVVFDANSFSSPYDTVTVNVPNAYCHDIRFEFPDESFSPTFMGADSVDLFVYGSFILNDSLNYKYAGEIFFDQTGNDKNPKDPDIIKTFGKNILNDIHFQGIGDIVMLEDMLFLFDNVIGVTRNAYLEHGTFITNGQYMNCGTFYSNYKNPRVLNIENSEIELARNNNYAWLVDADNLQFSAANSTLRTTGVFSFFRNHHGEEMEFNNVIIQGPLDSLVNAYNTVKYNILELRGTLSLVEGHYAADTILLTGVRASMFSYGEANVAIIDTTFAGIYSYNYIKKCIVNQYGLINGTSHFEHFVSNANCEFRGENTFDTLKLLPGGGDIGNTYFFESGKEQTIYDTLILRGNNCNYVKLKRIGNITNYPYLRVDNDTVVCDFLQVENVATIGDNSVFYAGEHTQEPDNPPPAWLWEGYESQIYGFNGITVRMCAGDELVLNAESFNGDANTLYYWDGSTIPGEINYTVTQGGQYDIKVQLTPSCRYDDYIIVEEDDPPAVEIIPTPCEGDIIDLSIDPPNANYEYQWFNGEQTPFIEASPEYSNTMIDVTVTDKETGCQTTATKLFQIIAKPRPEDYLADSINLKFGESANLDAGPGDTWIWYSDPDLGLELPDERYITVPGNADPVDYIVEVSYKGCTAIDTVIVHMYEQSVVNVPTAFSPNSDNHNPILEVKGSGIVDMTFLIFDRYGKKVFESNSQEEGWDGTVDGVPQPMEVYTYYLKVRFADGDYAEKKGNITLLR
ncbi:MAG: gliding motility-associated C-terminal domain-containing protein [Bacteroidales bacterium]|nr:gliding motility-associated C-terminal domain-containing protein [Bacteroidales bacterium]